VATTEYEQGKQAATTPEEIPEQVAQYGEVATSQVLAVNHPLPDAIVDIKALELLAGAPVMVPDDEILRGASGTTGRCPPRTAELVHRSRRSREPPYDGGPCSG
jgi:hypothetical protein